MPKVQPRTPSGFNEYLPADQLEFNRLLKIVRETYEKYGFAPLDTPDLELSEVLLAKGGGETEQQVYRFTRGRNDLTLRYDLTVPLARYVAEHQSDVVFPFRRYQIGKVHRAERAQAGRFREFYQCDIDVIGSKSPVIDAEFPAIINEIFTKFNFGEFTIRLNDRRILNGFLEEIKLTHISRDVLRIIDKMEKVSHEQLTKEFEDIGLTKEQVKRIFQFTAIEGENNDIIAQLRQLRTTSRQLAAGIDKLEALISTLHAMEVPKSRFVIDLKIARGLDYYTGTVYETILKDYPEVGSVCSGGRYDDLASHYTTTSLPGVGISIGLTRLFYKLREIGVIQPRTQSPATIVVMPLDEEQMAPGIAVAQTLRNAEMAVMLYTEPDAAKKKMRFANRMGFRYVVLIGKKEAADHSVSLKDMRTGISETIAVAELVAHISMEGL